MMEPLPGWNASLAGEFITPSGIFPILVLGLRKLHCDGGPGIVEWSSIQRFTLNRTSVLRNAPEASGIYGLCNGDQWVYIGHTASLRKALLEYLRGQMPYVLQWQPRHFMFEVLPYKERISRQKALVAHYQPTCNRKVNSARSS